jgi:hypothetical protein
MATVKSAPESITADGLAVLLTRTLRGTDGNGPIVPGIKVRQYVRTHALDTGHEALEALAERPAYGNRSHVYAVPSMTDPIVRGLVARFAARSGQAWDVERLFAGYVIPTKPARKPATKRTKPAPRKRPTGGTLPVQTMAPMPESPA